MDGTLLDSKGIISDENKNALKLLAEKGAAIVLATGRLDLMIKSYIHELGIQAPVISCNGGLIRDIKSNKVYYKNLMDDSLSFEILDFCNKRNINYLVYTLWLKIFFLFLNPSASGRTSQKPMMMLASSLMNTLISIIMNEFN
jgi:hydroxymethylpyrimidine pyrophosphatase-like HAD family hydrolase